jgi:hypothetical protein
VRALRLCVGLGCSFHAKAKQGYGILATAGTHSLGRRIYTSAMLLLLFTHLSMGTNCSLTLNAEIQEALRQQNMSDLSSTINT